MENYKNPNIRFKGFTDPWEQRKFTDITFLSGEKNKDNLPYESYSVTNENGFVPQNEQFENGGTMATADKRMYYIVSKNSFAYNPARINVGSIGYYDGPENVIVSSLYEVFKTSEDVDDRYLWHWFKSNNFKKLIEQYQEGGVRLYFYYDKLCMCSLPTPSIQEQIKIGRYFDNLDHLITLHQRKYEKLLNIKKGLLEKMFPADCDGKPKIRFNGFSDAWEQRKFEEIFAYERPDKYIVKSDKYVDNAPTPVLTANKAFVLGYTEETNTYKKPCIIFDDFTLDNKLVNFDFMVKSSAMKILTTKPNYDLNFSYSRLKSTKIEVLGHARHYIAVVQNTSVFCPEITEQKQIGILFDKLDSLITLHQRKCEKLKNIKKSLIEKMFA